MVQELESVVKTEIAAQQSRPTLLIEFILGGGVGTIRYAATTTNVTFGGTVYYARSFNFESIKTTAEGDISQVVIALDDIDNAVYTYHLSGSFEGKQVIIKKVYRNILSSSAYYREVFNGIMSEPKKMDDEFFAIEASVGSKFQRRVLQQYYQRDCNRTFGDTGCNYNGFADLTSSPTFTFSGTADSGSYTTLVDSALTQAEDYWRFGPIEITISGETYTRYVDGFDAASDTITFDVALPVQVTAGSTFQVWKGCSKTYNSCGSNNNFGPSSDNTANWLGFKHIGGQILR